MLEFTRINKQMYSAFLKSIKTPRRGQREAEQPGQTNPGHWKQYAQDLEKELKLIQTQRIESRLKNEISEDLKLYSLTGEAHQTRASRTVR